MKNLGPSGVGIERVNRDRNQPVKSAAVIEALGRLEKALCDQEETLQSLSERLIPIMDPMSDEKYEVPPQCPTPVNISDRILCAGSGVERNSNFIRSLRNRLQI